MKKYFPIMLVLGIVAAFAFGLLQLFKLRFESGDVYPPYSSLRSDPLGTMAFYESLERLPGISARRDFSTANRLPDGRETAYLHLAAHFRQWQRIDEETFREINQFLTRGGRLVITMQPVASGSRRNDLDNATSNSVPEKVEKPTDAKDPGGKKPGPARPKKKRPKEELDEKLDFKTVSLKERWGLDFQLVDLKQGDNDVYEAVPVQNRTDLPLPESLDWHSGIVFTNLAKTWQTIYERGTNAVLIKRTFGPGTVIIATDSYFLSNEAVQNDRHADLLAWLAGPSRNFVFDEAHLGVTESSGVAGLMRKYRLHWLAAGLILLAGLFIWKNSSSLAPPHADEAQAEYITGKDAAAGFVNLLRRSIAPREVLAVCFAEWKKSVSRGGKYSTARLQQAEAVFEAENAQPPGKRDPVATYRKISSILETRNAEPETKP